MSARQTHIMWRFKVTESLSRRDRFLSLLARDWDAQLKSSRPISVKAWSMRYRSARSRATAFVGAKAVDKLWRVYRDGDSHGWKTSKSIRVCICVRSQREVQLRWDLLETVFLTYESCERRTRRFFLVYVRQVEVEERLAAGAILPWKGNLT